MAAQEIFRGRVATGLDSPNVVKPTVGKVFPEDILRHSSKEKEQSAEEEVGPASSDVSLRMLRKKSKYANMSEAPGPPEPRHPIKTHHRGVNARTKPPRALYWSEDLFRHCISGPFTALELGVA